MPIKSVADNLHSKTEFSIGRDVELHFCSNTCLLRDFDDRSRVVRTWADRCNCADGNPQ